MHASICLVISGACTKILFIIKVKVFVFVKWSCKLPSSCRLLSLERLAYFERVVLSSFFHTCHFDVLRLDAHFTTCHSNMGVQIIVVLNLGMSTLGKVSIWGNHLVFDARGSVRCKFREIKRGPLRIVKDDGSIKLERCPKAPELLPHIA